MAKFPKKVVRAQKPKMSGRGRTWDVVDVIIPSGERVQGVMDYTYGRRFYFEHDGKWYSASNLEFHESGGHVTVYDLRRDWKGGSL